MMILSVVNACYIVLVSYVFSCPMFWEPQDFLIYIYTSWSTRRCPGKFNIACLTYWKTMILRFLISYRSWMLQNALGSLSLSNIFFFWHFNIITLINPFSERFESRHERPTFFGPVPITVRKFSAVPIPVSVKNKFWFRSRLGLGQKKTSIMVPF